MAELSPQERLQPALLDRLTDHDPGQKIESRDRRVISVQRLRECIRRDLAWLLNCGRLESVMNLDEYPEVANSVLNYGIPDLSGASLAGANTVLIENAVRAAIVQFEPRLLKNSLKVTVATDSNSMNRNSMTFKIECEMWAQPVPLSLYLQTELDLETGDVSVKEGVR